MKTALTISLFSIVSHNVLALPGNPEIASEIHLSKRSPTGWPEFFDSDFPGPVSDFTIYNNSPYNVAYHCKGKYRHEEGDIVHFGTNKVDGTLPQDKKRWPEGLMVHYSVPKNGGVYCSIVVNGFTNYFQAFVSNQKDNMIEVRKRGYYRSGRLLASFNDEVYRYQEFEAWLYNWTPQGQQRERAHSEMSETSD